MNPRTPPPLPQYRDPSYLEPIEGTARDLIAVVDAAGHIAVQLDQPGAPTVASAAVPSHQTAIAASLTDALAGIGFEQVSQWDRRCGTTAVAGVAPINREADPFR